jgi:drug/metabolite transporter (DMT)-like permease
MKTLMYGMAYGLMFGLVSCIAVVIAILASKGVPKTFDREMYRTCFAASGIGAVMVILVAQRVARAEVTWRIIPTLLFDLGLFLFGIAMGCGVGVFVFKKPGDGQTGDEGLGMDSRHNQT